MHARIEQMPIFKKGMEIAELVEALLELADRSEEPMTTICGDMFLNAHNLAVKVASAEAADIYDIRMENAAIIRRSARELVVSTHSLSMFGFEHPEYYPLLRQSVEEYRLLFIDWVAGFDNSNYCIDRWGLFNPPGISPHDHDPDDDLPPGQEPHLPRF